MVSAPLLVRKTTTPWIVSMPPDPSLIVPAATATPAMVASAPVLFTRIGPLRLR
jgi:hypothetical protein